MLGRMGLKAGPCCSTGCARVAGRSRRVAESAAWAHAQPHCACYKVAFAELACLPGRWARPGSERRGGRDRSRRRVPTGAQRVQQHIMQGIAKHSELVWQHAGRSAWR